MAAALAGRILALVCGLAQAGVPPVPVSPAPQGHLPGIQPGAAKGGYWSSRTWSTGWYRPYQAAWPWWGASSVAWGVGSLATATAITSAINSAAYQQSTAIVVPQTSLQLDYGSVQALPPNGVQFDYGVAGMPLMTATTADQAQVLNASCHIAYGSV